MGWYYPHITTSILRGPRNIISAAKFSRRHFQFVIIDVDLQWSSRETNQILKQCNIILLHIFIIYFLFSACRFSVWYVRFFNLSRFSRYKYVDETSGALKLIKTRYFPRYVLFSLVSSIGIQSRYITTYISLANSQFFSTACRCFLHEHPSVISWRRRVYFRFFAVLR